MQKRDRAVVTVMPQQTMERLSQLHGQPFVSLSWSNVTLWAGAAPIIASLTLCLFWGSLFHFESINYTHCRVVNVVPSISAVTGQHLPEVRSRYGQNI